MITKIENRTFTMTEVNFVLYVFYIPVYNFLNLFVFRDVWYQWVTSWLIIEALKLIINDNPKFFHK